jgi:hypothetical protein
MSSGHHPAGVLLVLLRLLFQRVNGTLVRGHFSFDQGHGAP